MSLPSLMSKWMAEWKKIVDEKTPCLFKRFGGEWTTAPERLILIDRDCHFRAESGEYYDFCKPISETL